MAKNNPKTCKDPILQVDDKMVSYNFDFGSKDGFNVICNVVSILPKEFDLVTEVIETKDDCFSEETKNDKPMLHDE